MTREKLQIKLTELLPTAVFEEGGEWLNVIINPIDWLDFATRLRQDEELHFDYLFCLTCVDWKTHLKMVYHLESTVHRHIIVVKAQLDRTVPKIETASGIWRTADFHEREVYELFGVDFINHPDLRLLILPDGWEGKFPLRKDYEDAVNMIKL
ncbi:MAG: NADH-quinone oxidoreductase subunit C [Chitinophagaceae bacterium]